MQEQELLRPEKEEIIVEQMSFKEFIIKLFVCNGFVFGTLYLSHIMFKSIVFAFIAQAIVVFAYITWGLVSANAARLKKAPQKAGFFRKPFIQGCGITLYSIFYITAGISFGAYIIILVMFTLPLFSDTMELVFSELGVLEKISHLDPANIMRFVVWLLIPSLLASWFAAIIAMGLKGGTLTIKQRFLQSLILPSINGMMLGVVLAMGMMFFATLLSVPSVLDKINAFGDISTLKFGVEIETTLVLPWLFLIPISASILLIFQGNHAVAFLRKMQLAVWRSSHSASQTITIWSIFQKILIVASVLISFFLFIYTLFLGLNASATANVATEAVQSYKHVDDWVKAQISTGSKPDEIVEKIGDGNWNSLSPEDGLAEIIPEFKDLVKDSGGEDLKIKLSARALSPEVIESITDKLPKFGNNKPSNRKIAYCLRIVSRSINSELYSMFGDKIWLFSSHASHKKYWWANGRISNDVLSNKIRSSGGFCTKKGLIADEYQE